ncbi:MoaD/ThiS family protein [Sinanaerobacter chloroacetimidivorans]|uniref:MoaD/ThiS family protein n=1 Tax=Sinanaerobacter chloroacetimidivorans TaxID=2818044 RepID=A0A8J7W2B5_9FIRM|nr:MoaD/ThiS family protein [Sinanaerobacter chloroacetimidivorans]MBR0597858.1 MoaD/ThiS family protein [Sinanaerobacter chloroacetimidivorans]
MKIKINVSRFLNKYFTSTGDLELVVKEDAAVKDLLIALQEQYGVEILGKVKNDVQLRKYCLVIIDGRISLLNERVTGKERQIKLVPPISGG